MGFVLPLPLLISFVPSTNLMMLLHLNFVTQLYGLYGRCIRHQLCGSFCMSVVAKEFFLGLNSVGEEELQSMGEK